MHTLRRSHHPRRCPTAGTRIFLAAVLALASHPLPGCNGGAAPTPSTPQGVSPEGGREDWFSLRLNGQSAGFSRQREERLPDGAVATSVFQRLVIRRGAEPVTMEIESRIEETAQGAIRGYRLVQRMAAADEVTEGVLRGDRMEITSRNAGSPRKTEIPFDPAAVGPHRLERMMREGLHRSGDTLSATTFFPEKASCGKAAAVLGSEEDVEFPGGPRRLVRRTTRIDILPGIEILEWIDGAGEIWKTTLPLPGMSIETYRCAAEEILREKQASPPEIFFASSIRPDRPPRNPSSAPALTYRFTLKQGTFRDRGIDGVFRGTGQEVLREESPASRVVRISKVLPKIPVTRPVAPPRGEEGSAAPGVYIQSDDPLVQRLAREAAGEGTDAFATALRLERWVREHVNFKDLKTAFASAREVAERLEGDCTEHGVLLAALARASGIPARVVSGLVWYEGAFVGHLWTEVYIDRWVPLDGTRGQGEVGPDHIAITASALAGVSAADLFFDMVQVIGNLRIEVMEQTDR